MLFSSSYPTCGRLSRPQTTTPFPPLPEASEFRWGLPYLLPTLLGILQEASRVRSVGLKRDSLGGMFLLAPTALCGSLGVMQGNSGLPAYPRTYDLTVCTGSYLCESIALLACLAGISGKVCQGRRFPKGYACFR